MAELCSAESMGDMTFHHIGLLTEDVERSRSAMNAIGYNCGPVCSDPLQAADLVMCQPNDGMCGAIELVSPHDSNAALHGLLRRRGDYMYHACFSCSDIDKAIATLQKHGVAARLVTGPKPAVLFGGRCVAFLVIDGVGLVELLEQDAKDLGEI